MKTVNLLPGWYLLQQHRQKNIRVHIGVMLLLGLCIPSAFNSILTRAVEVTLGH